MTTLNTYADLMRYHAGMVENFNAKLNKRMYGEDGHIWKNNASLPTEWHISLPVIPTPFPNTDIYLRLYNTLLHKVEGVKLDAFNSPELEYEQLPAIDVELGNLGNEEAVEWRNEMLRQRNEGGPLPIPSLHKVKPLVPEPFFNVGQHISGHGGRLSYSVYNPSYISGSGSHRAFGGKEDVGFVETIRNYFKPGSSNPARNYAVGLAEMQKNPSKMWVSRDTNVVPLSRMRLVRRQPPSHNKLGYPIKKSQRKYLLQVTYMLELLSAKSSLLYLRELLMGSFFENGDDFIPLIENPWWKFEKSIDPLMQRNYGWMATGARNVGIDNDRTPSIMRRSSVDLTNGTFIDVASMAWIIYQRARSVTVASNVKAPESDVRDWKRRKIDSEDDDSDNEVHEEKHYMRPYGVDANEAGEDLKYDILQQLHTALYHITEVLAGPLIEPLPVVSTSYDSPFDEDPLLVPVANVNVWPDNGKGVYILNPILPRVFMIPVPSPRPTGYLQGEDDDDEGYLVENVPHQERRSVPVQKSGSLLSNPFEKK